MVDNASAPTLQLAPSKASSISRVNKDKTDVDGAGKFKVSLALRRDDSTEDFWHFSSCIRPV